MLTGLLLILKWIGIILLAIIGLLFLFLCIILFSPIRYGLKGEYNEEMRGNFSIKWLLGLVQIRGRKPPMADIEIQIRLFGKTLGGKKKKKKPNKKKKTPAQNDILYSREKSVSTKQEDASKEDTPKTPPDPPATDTATEEIPDTKLSVENMEKDSAFSEKKGIRRVKLAEIEEEPPKAPPTWDGTEDTAFFTGKEQTNTKTETKTSPKQKTQKREKLSRLQNIWEQFSKIEQKKEIIKAAWRCLCHMAKGILPKDLCLKGTFGTGNPVTTGYLLAAAGILKEKFGDHLQIQGDFTKRTAHDVTIQIKGKIVIGYLVFTGIQFVLAKPIRPLWNIFLKRRENHG